LKRSTLKHSVRSGALLLFVPFFAGCATSVEVTKLERDQASYMLVAHPGWLHLFGDNEATKQAYRQKAQELCGSNGIGHLLVDDPVGSEILPPRGYLRCSPLT
jgi:hypothetical protein